MRARRSRRRFFRPAGSPPPRPKRSGCRPARVARFLDRGRRTPVAIVIFRLEAGDVAVGKGEVQQRKKARARGLVEVASRSDLAGNAVPALRRIFIPVAGDLALLGGSLRRY